VNQDEDTNRYEEIKYGWEESHELIGLGNFSIVYAEY